MAETKRRNKTTDRPSADPGPGRARRTNVSIEDVPSRYGKRARTGPAASAAEKRRPAKYDGGARPGTRADGSAAGFSKAAPRLKPGGKPFRGRPEKTADLSQALKAAANRAVPEAIKQLAEVQTVILTATQNLLGLAESWEKDFQIMEDLLLELGGSNRLIMEAVRPLREHNNHHRKKIAEVYGHLSFQDLAGQRLNKVEAVLASLTELLAGLTPSGPPPKKAAFKKNGPRNSAGEARPKTRGPASPKRAERSAMKGPQAPGGALDQAEVDDIMEDL